jgi:protein O-GlcNAc transferase
LAEGTSMDATAPIAQLAAAIEHHRAGRLAEAERLYRLVCAADPQNARAFHLLGVVAHQLRREDAADLIGRALALDPEAAEAHSDRGVILAAQGRIEAAAASFARAVELRPDYDEALANLGAALTRLGRLDEAAGHFARAAERAPNSIMAHVHLAMALRRQGRLAEAATQYEKVLSLRPDFADAHLNLAALLQELGRLDEALVHCEQAVALRPDAAGARNNLGNILREIGRLDDALAQYDRALALDASLAIAHYNRGLALRRRGDIARAQADFARAVALEPRFLEAEFAACMAELPALYIDETEIAACRAAYDRHLMRLDAAVVHAGTPAALADAVGSHQPFYLAYQGCDDRALQARYGALVRRIMAARFPDPLLPPPPRADEPIRVGIVSAFFRQHSNWKIPISGWLAGLDRKRFRLFGYHTAADRDAQTDVAASLCERFTQGPLALAGCRDAILGDAPHVLLYPEIGMDKVTAQLAAQRLAPVQCASWGHPVTSGFPTIDYFLSSDRMEPPGAQAHYTERLVRLPNLSIFCEPVDAPPIVLPRAELGLRADAVAYWCGQSLPKYLPQFDEVFARIASAVGDCQFTFIEFAGGPRVTELFRKRLERAFARLGLRAADHCVVLPRLAPDRFIAAIGQCDIVLDSIGWSGCNSTFESLAHDLPIVTLAGEFMRGRHSSAILDMMDVGETIAHDLDDYVAIAAELGRNSAARAAARAKIAASKHRVYRDHSCIAALEDFLDRAVRAEAGDGTIRR